MMLPSIFGENLFDDWMDDFPVRGFLEGEHNPLYGKHAKNLMKTDVKELEKGYEVAVDLPGFKKDDLHVELNNGYLTISASKSLNKDEKDQDGKYLRQERYAGSCSRSFYVGEGVEEKDIHAKFEDGTLRLAIPKKDPKAIESKKCIAIEG
ncbi:MAG: Hsp20/alpha crystallin family protein [Acidaminococcaceae bacterium]|jgi:HSP20 family protein|nr:Hsp20/alpha crystallin family protein [Acidaminococcaceae bacterium]